MNTARGPRPATTSAVSGRDRLPPRRGTGRLAAVGVALGLALVGLAACDGGTAANVDAAPTPAPDAAARGDVAGGGDAATGAPCGPPLVVTSKEEVIAIIEALPWSVEGPYGADPRALSRDIEVVGTITLSDADLADPDGDTGCPPVQFDWNESAWYGGGPWWELEEPDTLTLSGTFRLCRIRVDIHPAGCNFVPILDVREPCAAPCRDDEERCGDECVRAEDVCDRCDGRPAWDCACREGRTPQPDGTACEYFISGDVTCGGVCDDGTCVSADTCCGCPRGF